MTATETAFAFLSAVVIVLGGAAGVVRWSYTRGRTDEQKAAKSAASEAKLESLEQQLAETRRRLDDIQKPPGGTGQP